MTNFTSEYFNWMLLGALILAYGRQLFVYKPLINLLVLTGLIVCLFYSRLPLSNVLVSCCLCLWILEQRMHSAWLLINCSIIALLALFLQAWIPLFLVTSGLMFLLFKSWFWVNRPIDYFSLAQLLCVLLMGSLLVLNSEAWVFGLAVLSFLVLFVSDVENDKLSPKESDAHWLDMVEQSRILERQRIYSNIHDEVGASLLHLIYQLDGKEEQLQAKSVMQKIRKSVADTSQYTIKFTDLYQDICSEAQVRLRSAGITFYHEKIIENDSYLDVDIPVNLARMVRESVSNIIRHSGASSVRLRTIWQDQQKALFIEDNGRGLSAKNKSGKGINSIKKRAKRINAKVSWHQVQPAGTALHIEMINDD